MGYVCLLPQFSRGHIPDHSSSANIGDDRKDYVGQVTQLTTIRNKKCSCISQHRILYKYKMTMFVCITGAECQNVKGLKGQ